MKHLYEKEQVFGVIGNVGTPTAVVALPYALERKMLFFGAFTGAGLLRNDPPDRYVFNYRCAAHEYRTMASGHAHFMMYNKLMPWDHLAGVLIHQEAGGYSARFDGSLYVPGHVDGGLLVAPDLDSWRDLREALWAE